MSSYVQTPGISYGFSLLSDYDLYLFNEGAHARLYEKLGAHQVTHNGARGVHFAVWAPDAWAVFVMGDFNGWNKHSHPLRVRGSSGIWEGFVPGMSEGTSYKFHVESRYHGFKVDKADPYAFFNEVPPRTASIVRDIDYQRRDEQWMQIRHERDSLHGPISIYEMHIGSWMRVPEQDNRPLGYRELAPKLAEYVKRLGFTHVEFLPVM